MSAPPVATLRQRPLALPLWRKSVVSDWGSGGGGGALSRIRAHHSQAPITPRLNT